MIPLLAPLFAGEWAAFGAGLSCAAPPAHATRLDRLLADPRRLDDLLRQHARHLGSGDLRPVSVGWLLDYCWLLLPPFVAAATLLRRRLPLAPGACWLSVDEDGHPACLYLPDDGAFLPQAPAAQRYGELLRSHLPPLVAALARHGRVAERLLWGNVARRLEAVFEQVLHAAGDSRAGADAELLLATPAWPDGLPNPLYRPARGVLRERDGRVASVVLHRACCLCYLLPGEAYCDACPLAPANRRGAAPAPLPGR